MKEWLKNAVLYQIYPTSFYDSNGDGIGDLKGITQKLDYVKSLGVDVIWINPIFESEFRDGGYDVIDYRKIDDRFGTMQDFDAMIKRAKELGLKVCLDLVIAHTSWKCKWFQKSAEKERNEYSDYYVWTNSIFNPYKEMTVAGLYERDGCYLSNYYACQPSLNFGFNKIDEVNEEVWGDDSSVDWQMHYTDKRLEPLRNEMIDIIEFWLAKGIDGFRVDMANSLVKNWNGSDEGLKGSAWVWDKILSKVRADYPESIFIAEWCNPKASVGKCGFDADYIYHCNYEWNSLFRNEEGTNLIRSFECGKNYFSEEGRGDVKVFLDCATDINETIKGKGYFSATSGSHDEVRLATKKSVEQLKVIFAFLLTFKHFPFIYYGDEIGMTHNFEVSKDGGFIRTGCRTPMQWTNGKNRGFSESDGELYLPTNYDNENCSVESQIDDENSLLNTVKKLIKIRKSYSCLNADADFKLLECVDGGYPLAYERKDDKGSMIVALNPSKESKRVSVKGKVVYGNNYKQDQTGIELQGVSFVIVER